MGAALILGIMLVIALIIFGVAVALRLIVLGAKKTSEGVKENIEDDTEKKPGFFG